MSTKGHPSGSKAEAVVIILIRGVATPSEEVPKGQVKSKVQVTQKEPFSEKESITQKDWFAKKLVNDWPQNEE